jgi:hypothetical protein
MACRAYDGYAETVVPKQGTGSRHPDWNPQTMTSMRIGVGIGVFQDRSDYWSLTACGATGHFPTWNAPNFD